MKHLFRSMVAALDGVLGWLDGLLRQWPVAGLFVLMLILAFAGSLLI